VVARADDEIVGFGGLWVMVDEAHITTFAVDEKASTYQIDNLKVDLDRYGIPKVDQRKIVIPPSKGPTETEKPEAAMPARAAGGQVDSTAVSNRLLSKPPPAVKPKPKRRTTTKAKRPTAPAPPTR